jgi:outer membrane lipoprotein-sorting protein
VIRFKLPTVVGIAFAAQSAAAQPKSDPPKADAAKGAPAAPAPAATAAQPDPTKLMESVESRPDGKDQLSTVTLEIQPKKGAKRVRQFTLMRKEYPDTTKLVTFFTSPADIRNAAFLVSDEHGKPDPRWLYLPSVSQVRRLTSNEDRGSFFGSDFVYEDLTNRDPELDTHTLVGPQKYQKWDCWVVESTPKDASSVDFVKYRSWIWKDDPIVLRQEYYDKAGKVVKRGEVKSIKKIQNIWTWHQGSMTNVKTGSTSRLEVSGVKYDTGIADERFTEAKLSAGVPAAAPAAPATPGTPATPATATPPAKK